MVPVSQTMAHDILEARLYAERVNAELAAVRATQQERDYLVQTLKDLQENLEGRDGQLLYRVDHRFHRGVAAAAHNQLMYRQSEVLLDHYLRFEVKSVYNNSIDGKIVFEEHVAILDAIQSGNGERAKQAMEKHLTNSYRRTVSQFWP